MWMWNFYEGVTVSFFKNLIYLEGTFKWPSNFNLQGEIEMGVGEESKGELDLCKGLKIHIPFND